MDRKEILQHLLKLVSQGEDPDSARLADDYAGVSPETRREVVGLWGNALLQNTWLIPDMASNRVDLSAVVGMMLKKP